jgi:O-antigen biosynthesis protein WbqV
VLLAGAGEGSALMIRAVTVDPKALYRVVGILDLNARVRGRNMHGVPVLGSVDELESVVRRLASAGNQPKRLVLTEPVDAFLLRQLMDRAEALGITVARLPSLVEFRAAVDDGRIELQAITPQELLGRPQITFDHQAVRHLVEGRRVLVTGAGGSIGGELVRQIASHRPSRLVLLDSCEFNLYTVDQEVATRFPEVDRTALLADVRVRERVRAIFEEHRPELVFHAAALKHVPMVELNPVEGALTNVVGTRNVADAAWACGALAMVQISTDKAVNPTSVMGATKRLAELYCQILDRAAGQIRGADDGASRRPRFMTVRFGNVLGSSGSVVPLFRKQLADGGPLTVTHPDICRYFMTVREAVELVLQAAARGVAQDEERGGVFVLDMGEPVRIVDLARQMIRLAGKEPERDVPIVFTGLRPGEKLYEELFDASEMRLPAVASGVLMARPYPVDAAELRRALSQLAEACDQGDATALRAVLARAVPGYGTTETRANAA